MQTFIVACVFIVSNFEIVKFKIHYYIELT